MDAVLKSPPVLRAAHALRHVTVVLTVFLYTCFAPFGYGLFSLMVFLPARAPERRAARLRAAMRAGFRFMHAWLRLFRIADVRYQGLSEAIPPGPAVVIANHPTLLDITALLVVVPSGCTIVKPEIYRKWWLRPLMEGSGQIEGASGNPLGAAPLVERAAARLAAGMSVVIFPEATRTVEGVEMPFHRLAFEVAARANVPIVQIFLRCEPSWLSKQRPLFRPPSQLPVLTLSMVETHEPRAFGHDSRRLCEHARTVYRGLSKP